MSGAAHLVNQGVATENASGGYTTFNNSSILENAIGGTLNLTDGSRASITAMHTANLLENDVGGTINYAGSTTSSSTSHLRSPRPTTGSSA